MKRAVFLFWGCMDLFFILHFLWSNFGHGRIPFYTDFRALGELGQPFWFSTAWLVLSLFLVASTAVSAWLFLSGHRFAKRWAYAQTPLRLVLAEPSLSFIPMLLNIAESHSLVLNLSLLIGSEVLKVYTLYRYGRVKDPITSIA